MSDKDDIKKASTSALLMMLVVHRTPNVSDQERGSEDGVEDADTMEDR